MSLVDSILTACAIADLYDRDRTLSDILAHATSEVGELADEVIIASGRSYKTAGPDGIIGEGVDAIICILDLMRKYRPNITEAELIATAERKCVKWVNKLDEQQK